MAELDERVSSLERWASELEEDLRRIKTILGAIGTVAGQAAASAEPD